VGREALAGRTRAGVDGVDGVTWSELTLQYDADHFFRRHVRAADMKCMFRCAAPPEAPVGTRPSAPRVGHPRSKAWGARSRSSPNALADIG